MRRLLYYPGFNIANNTWLKFALLYIDRLMPIIPYRGRDRVNETTRILLNETDLLEPYNPKFDQASRASFLALEHIEDILRNPLRYNRLFRDRNTINNFMNPEKRSATLYHEKYTYEFGRFCIENHLASEVDDGILLNSILLDIYMSILANEISDTEGVDNITDQERRLNYNTVIRNKKYETNYSEISLASKIIPYYLPLQLKEIPLSSLISIRNSKDFKECISAFHDFIEYCTKEDINNIFDFTEKLEEINRDIRNTFVREYGLEFVCVAITVLSACSVIPLNPIIGASATAGSFGLKLINYKYTTQNNNNVRKINKYVAQLNRVVR